MAASTRAKEDPMGTLVDGVWHRQSYAPEKHGGKFVRAETQFRDWITRDGRPAPGRERGFKAKPGRYHLYVSLACPWAHRTLIFRKLKKLEDVISTSVVHHFLVEDGWLAHYLNFAGDHLLPPMAKLLEQPFWLDGSDPHRMASAMQTLTRPHHYDVGIAAGKVFEDRTWRNAVHRVAAEGLTPEQAVDEAIARIKQILSE